MRLANLEKRTSGKRAKNQQRIRARKGRHLALESLEQRHLLSNVPLTIGDFVWHDLNGNGIQDEGEPGIEGVTVNLLNGDSTPVLDGDGNPVTDTTDADGFYSFTNLVADQPYRVEFELPEGFDAFSPRQVGTDFTKDSDGPVSEVIVMPQYGLTVDTFNDAAQAVFVNQQAASTESPVTVSSAEVASEEHVIGGERELVLTVTQTIGRLAFLEVVLGDEGFLVWNNGSDVISIAEVIWDGRGSGDAAEGLNVDLTRGGLDDLFFVGIPFTDFDASAMLTVDDNSGNTSSLTKLGLSGDARSLYQFAYDDFTGNADFTDVRSISLRLAGPVAIDLSLSLISTGHVANLNVDAGMFQYASLGDFVWLDLDGDGIQDAGEPGVEGVTVNLLDGDGNPVLDGNVAITTMTDATGFYEFTGLRPGTYSVEFELPEGYQFTQQVGVLDHEDNSDADPATGRTEVITLQSGEQNLNVDAGLVSGLGLEETASIGDFVWIDANADGIQNPDEMNNGLAGVEVELLNEAGIVVATTTTIDNGFYEFTVTPGTYSVRFIAPDGYAFTQQVGDLNVVDNSDANPETGETIQFTVNSGDALPYIDAGLVPLGGGEDEDFAAIQLQKLVGIEVPVVSGEWEGLTPGFWRTHSEFGPAPLSGWPETGYRPWDSYNEIFGVNVPGDPTLLDATCANGGGVRALMRHSAAALLNAAHPNINYGFSVADVIKMTKEAIESDNAGLIESTKDQFDFANNRGADLTTGGSSGGSSEVVFYDANTAEDGPTVAVGDTVWFQVLIRNTGQVSLADIEVIDEMETPDGDIIEIDPDVFSTYFVGGDDNDNGELDPGEKWVFEYSITAGAAGVFENWAEVFATPVDGGKDVNALDNAIWTVVGDSQDDGSDDSSGELGIDELGIDEPGGTQGLTPGFWRQSHHVQFWPEGYAPDDWYTLYFVNADVGNDVTLMDALTANGGGVNALLRHSAAALLNAAHPEIDYAYTVDQVITMVEGAFGSGDFETTKDLFDTENNRANVDLKSGSGSNGGGSTAADEGSSSNDDYDDFFTLLDDDDEQDNVGKGKGKRNGNGRGK